MLQPITQELFEVELAKGDTFVVDFYADWCKACELMLPVVESVSSSYEAIPFYKVNIDEHPELMERARIKAIPMLMIYSEGKMRAFVYGNNTKETIEKKLDMVIRQ
jgi:thioredoxin 1